MKDLIDSHFHLLEIQKKGIPVETLLENLKETGIIGGIDIGVSEDDIIRRSLLLERYPHIKRAAGIGPWGAQGEEPIDEILCRFETLIADKRVDCIGEIGLDYYWNYGTVERQERLFIEQIELANKRALPIIIHCRDADEHMIQVLKTTPITNKGILHCFSGSWALAEQALESGLLISFAGPITYKKNEELRQMLSKVPIDRLLLETDSPYLSPEPRRGKVNTPSSMQEIYQRAAMIRGISVEELTSAIKTNFAKLFL